MRTYPIAPGVLAPTFNIGSSATTAPPRATSRSNECRPAIELQGSVGPTEYLAGPPESLIYAAPDRHAMKYVQRDLDIIPWPLRQIVRDSGSRVLVVGGGFTLSDVSIRGMPLLAPGTKTFQGLDWGTMNGVFLHRHELMVVRENCLGGTTTIHEFAHALDYALDRSNRYSLALWNRFASRRGFITPYAGTNPREYFAVSFAAMFFGFDRSDLRTLDPGMHQFLEDLLEVPDLRSAQQLPYHVASAA